MQGALKDDGFAKNVIFSHQTTFNLSVKVNRHNVRAWSSEPPLSIVQLERNSREDRFYVPPQLTALPELEFIRAAVISIDGEMLQKVWAELDYRVDHFETQRIIYSSYLHADSNSTCQQNGVASHQHVVTPFANQSLVAYLPTGSSAQTIRKFRSPQQPIRHMARTGATCAEIGRWVRPLMLGTAGERGLLHLARQKSLPLTAEMLRAARTDQVLITPAETIAPPPPLHFLLSLPPSIIGIVWRANPRSCVAAQMAREHTPPPPRLYSHFHLQTFAERLPARANAHDHIVYPHKTIPPPPGWWKEEGQYSRVTDTLLLPFNPGLCLAQDVRRLGHKLGRLRCPTADEGELVKTDWYVCNSISTRGKKGNFEGRKGKDQMATVALPGFQPWTLSQNRLNPSAGTYFQNDGPAVDVRRGGEEAVEECKGVGNGSTPIKPACRLRRLPSSPRTETRDWPVPGIDSGPAWWETRHLFTTSPVAAVDTVTESRVSGNRDGRCRWSTGSLGDLPFPPPLHSSTAPLSHLTFNRLSLIPSSANTSEGHREQLCWGDKPIPATYHMLTDRRDTTKSQNNSIRSPPDSASGELWRYFREDPASLQDEHLPEGSSLYHSRQKENNNKKNEGSCNKKTLDFTSSCVGLSRAMTSA
ncbi:hypothetical protein PR048_004604 [Dryococelus australis]|uniref:Uncharacterized protein n=1 Tax=Dryococelus australis TaxID=614101 RepID=A0ABQ9I5V8_9NEOP|nr:hypothetical protein PR048_004604 [Dryococelus australis]